MILVILECRITVCLKSFVRFVNVYSIVGLYTFCKTCIALHVLHCVDVCITSRATSVYLPPFSSTLHLSSSSTTVSAVMLMRWYTSVYLPTFSSTLYLSSSSSSVAAVMLKTNMHCAKPKFFFRIQSN